MAEATVKTLLRAELSQVWTLVTDLTRWDWRSDLREIRLCQPNRFVEVTKSGFETAFTVTQLEPMTRYAFTMENGNMRGEWSGLFRTVPAGIEITFTERVTVKKAWMRPFAGVYLKRQQRVYLADLKRALGER